MESGVIPIVNENDSISTAEIETGDLKVLGDNDTLSAVVGSLCRADLLVILSDIDAFYDEDPRANQEAQPIRIVTRIDEELASSAKGAGSWRGTGGMQTKLEAAKIAMENGFDMVITHGSHPENLYDILEGKEVGTRFIAPTDAADGAVGVSALVSSD